MRAECDGWVDGAGRGKKPIMSNDQTSDGNYIKFKDALIRVIQPVALARIELNRGETREWLRDLIFNEPEPRQLRPLEHLYEKFITDLWNEFHEIVKSYDNLKDIEIYIRRFPYRRLQIKPSRYLRYHIENYLHEIYILSERFNKFLTVLQRKYRKSLLDKEVRDICKNLEQLRKIFLDDLVKVRAGHVHKNRYTDNGIERLEFIEMMTQRDPKTDTRFSELSKSIYREIRTEWVKIINGTNLIVLQFLDSSCKFLLLLFDSEGNFMYPDNLINK